jgi:hypothetical protein
MSHAIDARPRVAGVRIKAAWHRASATRFSAPGRPSECQWHRPGTVRTLRRARRPCQKRFLCQFVEPTGGTPYASRTGQAGTRQPERRPEVGNLRLLRRK